MNSTERLRSFHRCITAKTRSDRSGGRAAVISSSSEQLRVERQRPGQVEHPQERQRHVADLLVEVEPVEVHRRQLGPHRGDVGAGQAEVLRRP